MLEIAPLTAFYGATMNSQVHDELVFIVPEETAEPFSLVVQDRMEAAGKHFNMSVPIIAEPNIGNNWLEAK
jgi:DNA polymerase I-like protein with 3'-5' exonuclease and polymerase domains